MKHSINTCPILNQCQVAETLQDGMRVNPDNISASARQNMLTKLDQVITTTIGSRALATDCPYQQARARAQKR